jgi:hypothetical protein
MNITSYIVGEGGLRTAFRSRSYFFETFKMGKQQGVECMTLDDKVDQAKTPTVKLERRFCVGYRTKCHDYFVEPATPIPSIQYCLDCETKFTVDHVGYIAPFPKEDKR